MKRLALFVVFFAIMGSFFVHLPKIHADDSTDGTQSSSYSDLQDGTTTPDETVDAEGNPIISPDSTNTSDITGVSNSTDQIPSEYSSAAYAATTNAGDIDADIEPQNPGAFTQVTVTLDSNVVDLRRYQITWFINGTQVGTGIGKYTLAAETGGYGTTTNIRAAIALDTGTINKDIALTPEDMTMMWEAVDAYAPPFYQGKKLPGRESIIKIVAIPNFIENGTPINPADAVYSWQRNGNVITTASGYGNDALLIKQNMLNATEQIQATASDDADNIQATGDITIPLFNPKILFYSIDPTTGIQSPIAQSSIDFDTPSTTLVAEPYNFSVTNDDPNTLTFNWTMNDNPITISDPNNQNTLDLQNPGTSGEADIGLSITDPLTSFQTAQSDISAVFNSK